MHISNRILSDYLSQRNCQNQQIHSSFSHIEPECWEIMIQGKIHVQGSLNTGHNYS